jgi:hypothetical protein
MNVTDEITVIEEKFTRCPHCRSYSVKVTKDLRSWEKFKGIFLPVTAFKCSNCSYRFVEYGRFIDTLKNLFISMTSRVERKWLLVVVPLGIIAIVTALLVFLEGNNEPAAQVENRPPVTVDKKPNPVPEKQPEEKQQVQPSEKQPEDKQPQVKPQDQPPDQPPEIQVVKKPQDHLPVPPAIAAYIELGNSNRFGVNWASVKLGVRITRLSDGPLKRAGIKLGDILAEVDDRQIMNGNWLIRIRNEIFSGRRDRALIKVVRDDAVYLFELVKFKREPPGESSEPTPLLKLESGAVKVFSGSTLKVRSTSPDREGESHRWFFLAKEITIRRNADQRVFVAGNATGTQKWGVDNQLVINGRTFKGITVPYDSNLRILPETSMCMPLDITSLVPPDRAVRLKVQLADYGILWGNTDIYIVVTK